MQSQTIQQSTIESLLYLAFQGFHPHNVKSCLNFKIEEGNYILESLRETPLGNQLIGIPMNEGKNLNLWFKQEYQTLQLDTTLRDARDQYYTALNRRERIILTELALSMHLSVEDTERTGIAHTLRMKSQKEIQEALKLFGVRQEGIDKISEIIKPQGI